ncbi:MAG: NAD(P)H-hydrate dehydratase [Candidatus Omnitrophota bacterium]|nr:NAD(P)H-hydrate dehydratase [Candidatus Omnitrophota bacterium]
MIKIEDILANFPKRASDANKRDFGHVLVIAGSIGYTGAAYLTSQAALLSGSGLVTLAAGKSICDVLATKLTEVMVKPFFETRDYSLSLLAEKELLNFSRKCSAVAIGPGISQNKETQALVRSLLGKLDKPIVLDADGINAFVAHVDLLNKTAAPLILTPHMGEMARLLEKEVEEVKNNRKDIALEFASKYNVILALKGHETIVAKADGAFYINATGNVGMASGGTGDVLTGIITSFVGQGMDAFNAAAAGVYFHGMAGDIAVKEKGNLSLIATDLLNKLPEVLKTLS